MCVGIIATTSALVISEGVRELFYPLFVRYLVQMVCTVDSSYSWQFHALREWPQYESILFACVET